MRTLLHCAVALAFSLPAVVSAGELEVEALAGAKQLFLDDYEGLAFQSEAGVRVSTPLGEGSAISLVVELLEGRVARRGEGYGVGLATHEPVREGATRRRDLLEGLGMGLGASGCGLEAPLAGSWDPGRLAEIEEIADQSSLPRALDRRGVPEFLERVLHAGAALGAVQLVD